MSLQYRRPIKEKELLLPAVIFCCYYNRKAGRGIGEKIVIPGTKLSDYRFSAFSAAASR